METKINRANRRKIRVRAKIDINSLRLSISRSDKFLYAQIIDDKNGKTLIGITSRKFVSEGKKNKADLAKEFGIKFGKEASALGIKEVVFDRGSYLFHGRVKAFADGAREGGLKF